MKVFIFESTRAVIKSETAVRAAEIDCRVIPVPRSVSPLCGMALEIDDESEQSAAELLEKLSISVKIFDRGDVRL